MDINTDQHWMEQALLEAKQAEALDEVPVGAIIVLNGEVIGRGFNQPISQHDPTAHAEIMALRQASQHMNNYRLPGAEMYVTIEPCTMCCGAIIHARLKRIIFGAHEPKAGAVESAFHLFEQDWINHHLSYTAGVLEEPCRELIHNFFSRKRAAQKRLKKK